MGLPPMRADGHLPIGRHSAPLEAVGDRFVRQAPGTWDREGLFRVLCRHLKALTGVTGSTSVWLGGGLISHSPTAEEEVMVLGLCRDKEHLRRCLRDPASVSLLTVDDAIIGSPFMAGTGPLLPFGGDIDASLAEPSEVDIWHRTFSWLSDDRERGYVEVRL